MVGRPKPSDNSLNYTRLTALCPGLPRWAGTREVKPIWILLEKETVSGSGISWAICKSASRSSQITMPAPHHSFFTGWMPFLPPNQQRQSTKDNSLNMWQNNGEWKTIHSEIDLFFVVSLKLWGLGLKWYFVSVVPGSVGFMTCCLLYIIDYGWTGTVWKRCPQNVNGQYNPIETGIDAPLYGIRRSRTY